MSENEPPLGPEVQLDLKVLPQPDETTCGPTCLHAVYRYYGDEVDLHELLRRVPVLDTGGTLAVHLACDALERGYSATIVTYNLQIFDPTWFAFTPRHVAARLEAQMRVKDDPKLRNASQAYLKFLSMGGRIVFENLTPRLIHEFLDQGRPILTGLSATYLYKCAREFNDQFDDVRGEPMGHFAIITGYDPIRDEVTIADPLGDNPAFEAHEYRVGFHRLAGAIFLGIVTYDANLLVLAPR